MLSSFFLLSWTLVPFSTPLLAGPAKIHTTGATELIVKLGSRDYREREYATKELDALGGAALPELRKAVHDKDPEVRRRAEKLTEIIERREESARLLAPRTVRLKLENVPLQRAVAELSQKSGFEVAIDESAKSQLQDHKITLDTGDTTFWRALDALDTKASLVDSTMPRDPRRNQRDGKLTRNDFAAEPRLSMYLASQRDGATRYYLHPLDKVKEQKGANPAVCYAGALRLRIGNLIRVQNGEIVLPVEVSPQPNVLWEDLVDIRVEKAIDERGQNLIQSLPGADSTDVQLNRVIRGLGNGFVLNAATGGLDRIPDRNGFIRLKSGELASRKLSTLAGTIVGQMRTPLQPMVTVENVRNQAGKTFRTRYGESLELAEVQELSNGSVKLHIRLLEPPTMLVMPGNGRIAARANIVLQGQQVVFNRLGVRLEGALQVDLVAKDARGRKLPFEPSSVQHTLGFFKNMITTDVMLVVKAGQGESALHTLEWAGQHDVTVEVPFSFSDVQLP